MKKIWVYKTLKKKTLCEWSNFRISARIPLPPPKKKNENNLKQRNKHYHTKLLLNSFHLNGHPLGFLIKTQESGTALYIRINTTPENYCSAAKGKLQNDLRCDFECAFFFLTKMRVITV